MKIVLASDHAGYTLKGYLKTRLETDNHTVLDCGTHSEARVDYIVYTLQAVEHLTSGVSDRAILFCGNGFAMAMLANRFPGIHAAVCHDVFTARTCREMGNANAIAFGARIIGPELAWELTQTWLCSEFIGETVERYARRQQQLAEFESQFARDDWQERLRDYLAQQRT